MRYFVLAPDGQRYGPADLKTLGQWVSEGRILSGHMLEEEGTGRRLSADSLPGIGFTQTATRPAPPTDPFAQAPAPLTASFQAPPNDAAKLVQNAWVLGAVSFALLVGIGCCSPVSAIGSVAAGAVGLTYANRAKILGDPRAQGPLVMNGILVGLAVLRILASFGHFFPRSW